MRTCCSGRSGPCVAVCGTPDGVFTVTSPTNQYRARAVILGLGRSGTPRKLGVRGEELAKVMYRLIEADHYNHKKILIVGGGDSAVEAALGLAQQKGNQVTLSYRRHAFSRIKERNARHLAQSIATNKLKVLFNSAPVEFKRATVVLSVQNQLQTIANDFVWIFAGGKPPNDFLNRIGVTLGMRDMTLEASHETAPAALPGSHSVTEYKVKKAHA